MSDRMLPKLNRNTSMVLTGTGQNQYHSLNPTNTIDENESPLRLFARAKGSINSIYNDFRKFLVEINNFLETEEFAKGKLLDDKDVAGLKAYQEMCDRLLTMISRDRMKVVFFGRTSNGKSTTINAMLREKILPTGIGHTTNCFLQVEGSDVSDSSEACIFVPDSDTPQSVKNLSHLGSALSNEKLDSSSLVRVLWPKEKCHLLKEDVVLVDSPGIDVSSDLDSWIDRQCLDADVFVLVVNAESTLTKTEKEFFHKVSERLSMPNVFILNNRWDATAYEPETAEEVKAQHIERNTEFLCTELKVCDPQEVNNRIYFVSAREALLTRTQTNPQLPPGFQSRLLQFEWFETEFEKCISMSAVKTKFDQPSQRGKMMASHLKSSLEKCNHQANELKQLNEQNLRQVTEKIELIERKLQEFTEDIKDRIRHVMDDVEKNVSIVLNDEIKRLYYLIDLYERPFHPEEHQLNWYKKELHSFVEQKLGSNLASRLNLTLAQNLELTQRDIRTRVLELVVSDENKKIIAGSIPRADFVINYCLDCSNLCSEFKEDISFQFSLGFTALMRRFTGQKGALFNNRYGSNTSMTARLFTSTANLFNPNQDELNSSSSAGAPGRQDFYQNNKAMQASSSSMMNSSSNLNTFASPPQNDNATNLLVMMQALQLVTSRSNVVLVVVGGVVWRGLGWKILAITGSLYGLVYLYERLMWTRKKQEKLFKKQYADFASSKLRLIVDLTSQNAAHQVQRELSQYFAQMCRYIDITKDEYFEELRNYEKDIKMFRGLAEQTRVLRSKGIFMQENFDKFIEEFIKKAAQNEPPKTPQ